MPQLMPLNWVFSGMMMMLILISISLIYSEKESVEESKIIMYKYNKKMNIWCW
uniref:ATP synthase F0 subunit 8 n=1 Tax=Araneus quadratus TaxID=279270 RepID=A0A7M4C8U2_9ARAC|nr:ATP synthase F0 subunit 8 [Araneus quadratus]